MSQHSRGSTITSVVRKYKVILLGELGAGKTSLFRRLKGLDFVEFHENMAPGVEKCIVKETVNDHRVHLEIFEPAGMQRIGSLTRNYFLNAKCAIVIYDALDSASLSNNLVKWREEIDVYAPDAIQVLLGNKADKIVAGDLDHAEELSRASEVAHKYGFHIHKLISCKTGDGIKDVFETLTVLLYRSDTEDDQKSPYKNNIIRLHSNTQNEDEENDGKEECTELKQDRQCCLPF